MAPDNALGDAALGELQRYGVSTARVVKSNGRLGTYYLEAGAGHRASRVLYDRADSTLALANAGAIDWDAALTGAQWLHLSGITPAISASAAALTIEGVVAARRLGLTIVCDYIDTFNAYHHASIGSHHHHGRVMDAPETIPAGSVRRFNDEPNDFVAGRVIIRGLA